MEKQTIEGKELGVSAVFKNVDGNISIFCDKIEYDVGILRFFILGRETLRVPLKKQYDSIYEALDKAGISVSDY